jgi:hypothetical protein
MLETLVNSLFSKKRNLPPYLRVPFLASGPRMKESLPFKSVAVPRERGILGLSLTMMLTRRRAWIVSLSTC